MWGKGNYDFDFGDAVALKAVSQSPRFEFSGHLVQHGLLYQNQTKTCKLLRFQPCQRTCSAYNLTLDNRKKLSSTRVRSTTPLKSSLSSH